MVGSINSDNNNIVNIPCKNSDDEKIVENNCNLEEEHGENSSDMAEIECESVDSDNIVNIGHK